MYIPPSSVLLLSGIRTLNHIGTLAPWQDPIWATATVTPTPASTSTTMTAKISTGLPLSEMAMQHSGGTVHTAYTHISGDAEILNDGGGLGCKAFKGDLEIVTLVTVSNVATATDAFGSGTMNSAISALDEGAISVASRIEGTAPKMLRGLWDMARI